jgi:hydrogenase maturation protease
MQNPKIMVMGVGNILLSDEGLGVHLLNELTKMSLPENIELLEGGTAGLELVHLIQEIDFLIIVDAINANDEPGSIFRFQPEEINVLPERYEVSFHQVGIMEVLAMASILGHAPQTLIFGIQPKSLEWGLELTPEISKVFPKVIDLLMQEFHSIEMTGHFRELKQDA